MKVPYPKVWFRKVGGKGGGAAGNVVASAGTNVVIGPALVDPLGEVGRPPLAECSGGSVRTGEGGLDIGGEGYENSPDRCNGTEAPSLRFSVLCRNKL